MKIYTLYYKDTGLYNRSVFVLPNDAAAIKAMKLNLIETKAESFRNEARLGNTILKSIGKFNEEEGLTEAYETEICNLKELLDDDGGNTAPIQ